MGISKGDGINKKALKKTIAAIKKAPSRKIHMGRWYGNKYEDEFGVYFVSVAQSTFNPYKCNTTACIAGWAACANKIDVHGSPEAKAKAALGLDELQTHELFYRMDIDEIKDIIKKKIVVECLEHLLKTGEVDWHRAINKHVAKK